MTEIAVLLALGIVAVGVVLAFLLRLVPTVRLQLVRVAFTLAVTADAA